MPLISCPDCEKQVSDAAKACPNCGYPVSDLLAANPTAKVLSAQFGPCPNCVRGQVETDCFMCNGTGTWVCDECRGDGYKVVGSAQSTDKIVCYGCHGRPRHPCDQCGGRGRETFTCSTCAGTGQLTVQEIEQIQIKKEEKRRQKAEAQAHADAERQAAIQRRLEIEQAEAEAKAQCKAEEQEAAEQKKVEAASELKKQALEFYSNNKATMEELRSQPIEGEFIVYAFPVRLNRFWSGSKCVIVVTNHRLIFREPIISGARKGATILYEIAKEHLVSVSISDNHRSIVIKAFEAKNESSVLMNLSHLVSI